MRRSWRASRNEKRKHSATDSGAAFFTTRNTRATSAFFNDVMIEPSAASLSRTPSRSEEGTNGGDLCTKRSYNFGRACRAISSTSSKPAVVSNTTRPPRRSSNAFVPTVVPQTRSRFLRSADCAVARLTASMIASAGAAGREATLMICNLPLRTKTQSVNVPPLSIAMRMRG